MKPIVLVAAAAAICVFGVAGAMAADGTAYMAQCKANIASDPPPPTGSPMTNEKRLGLCQCIVDFGDQKVIDEALALAKLPMDQRRTKYATASQPLQTTIQGCFQKLNITFPSAPPAAPK